MIVQEYELEPSGEVRFEDPVAIAGRRHVFGAVLFC